MPSKLAQKGHLKFGRKRIRVQTSVEMVNPRNTAAVEINRHSFEICHLMKFPCTRLRGKDRPPARDWSLPVATKYRFYKVNWPDRW